VADNKQNATSGVPSNRRKVLLVSLGLAILAVLLLYIYTQQLAAKYGVAGEKVTLVAAKFDIAADKPISHDMLTQIEVPESYVHPQSVFINEWERIVGQRVAHTIREGQTLLWTDFSDPRSDVELDQVVKEGWRAMSIPVDQVSSMGGLLQPNDHVDILGTFLKPEKKGWVTITLLQNVTVLAVGAPLFGKDRGSSETVTLLVTPEEAELLTFSVDKGKISLSARNEDDITNDRALPPRGFRGIFGGKKREYFYRNDALTIELPEPSLIPLFD